MPIEVNAISKTGLADPKTKTSSGMGNFLSGSRPPGPRDRMAFTEQLALLVDTGMPLHAALHALSNQASTPQMRGIIDDVVAEVESGQRFAYALAKHPELFSTTYVNLVAAAEGSGFLPEVLGQLLEEEEKREELRKTVISALSYPGFLMVFSFLVVIFVLVVVFPKFGDMFKRIHDQLPATTIALMWFSDILRIYWVQVLAAMGAAAFLLRQWWRSSAGRATVDRYKLSLPGLSGVYIQLYLAQSFRVLSLSLRHGVSIVDALDATRDVVSNLEFRKLFQTVEASVREGGTISAGFESSRFVPDLVKQMVATAEAAGSLGPVLGRVAEHYEKEMTRRLDMLSKIAEPAMLLIMGVVVGVLVSSLILPIFKLSKAVN